MRNTLRKWDNCIPSGFGASNAEDAGKWINPTHDGADEGTPPRNDGSVIECGSRTATGMDRGAVVRGPKGTTGRKTPVDGVGLFGFSRRVGVRARTNRGNHPTHVQQFKRPGATRAMTNPTLL